MSLYGHDAVRGLLGGGGAGGLPGQDAQRRRQAEYAQELQAQIRAKEAARQAEREAGLRQSVQNLQLRQAAPFSSLPMGVLGQPADGMLHSTQPASWQAVQQQHFEEPSAPPLPPGYSGAWASGPQAGGKQPLAQPWAVDPYAAQSWQQQQLEARAQVSPERYQPAPGSFMQHPVLDRRHAEAVGPAGMQPPSAAVSAPFGTDLEQAAPGPGSSRGQQPGNGAGRGSMAAFGGARAEGRSGADEQRKAAYRAELELQMREKEDRRKQERAQQLREDALKQQEAAAMGTGLRLGGAGTYGGGSGPLRDEHGNIVTDLNRVRKYQQEKQADASLRSSLSSQQQLQQFSSAGSPQRSLSLSGRAQQQPRAGQAQGAPESQAWASQADLAGAMPIWPDGMPPLRQDSWPSAQLQQQQHLPRQPSLPSTQEQPWGPGSAGTHPAFGHLPEGGAAQPFPVRNLQAQREAAEEQVVVKMRSDRPFMTSSEAERRVRQQAEFKEALRQQVEEKRRAKEEAERQRRAEDAAEEARLAREQEVLRQQFEVEQAQRRAKQTDKAAGGVPQAVEEAGMLVKFKPPPVGCKAQQQQEVLPQPAARPPRRRPSAAAAQDAEQQRRQSLSNHHSVPPAQLSAHQPKLEDLPLAQQSQQQQQQQLQHQADLEPDSVRSALARQQREIDKLKKKASHTEQLSRRQEAWGAPATAVVSPPGYIMAAAPLAQLQQPGAWVQPMPPPGWNLQPVMAPSAAYGMWGVPPVSAGYMPPPVQHQPGLLPPQLPPLGVVPVFQTVDTLRDSLTRPATGNAAVPRKHARQETAEQSMSGISTLVYPKQRAQSSISASRRLSSPLPMLASASSRWDKLTALPFSRQNSTAGLQGLNPLLRSSSSRTVAERMPWAAATSEEQLRQQQNAAALAALERLEAKHAGALDGIKPLDRFLLEVNDTLPAVSR